MQAIAIADAKMSDIVTYFNTFCVLAQDVKKVKKFENRQKAEARANKLTETLASYLPKNDPRIAPEGCIFVGELVTEEGEELDLTPVDVAPVAALVNGHDEEAAEEEEDEEGPVANSFGSIAKTVGAMSEKTEAAPVRTTSNASNSLGISLSWQVPDVRARRLTRDSVQVTVDGVTQPFKSSHEAFRYFRLPTSKSIRFRLKLKASRAETFEFNGKGYLFEIVEGGADSEE